MLSRDTDYNEIVERALWDGISAKPDNQVIMEPGWVQQTTPHAPTSFLNGVYRCEIDDDSIIARVQATIAHYKKLGLPFRWKVAPSSRPLHLASLLIENGLELRETLYGLVAAPHAIHILENPRVRVEAVSLSNLEDWLVVQSKAWGVPPVGISHMRESMSHALERGDESYLNFLAYMDGEPVGSAALRFFHDYGFLMGAAVNPEQRRQGVYRTLLSHRLAVIGRRELPAVIHCLENTSAPICLRLGFKKICEIQSYEPKRY